MAYDTTLADRVRNYLSGIQRPNIEEKKMFGGLAFLVNGKMCVNVSGQKLMCRFDPALQEQIEKRTGYQPMIMKGKPMAGYCYVEPQGFAAKKDFDYWMELCLSFNEKAQKSGKK